MERLTPTGSPSDLALVYMTPDQITEMIDDLTFAPITPEEEAAILAELPPANPHAPILIVPSINQAA